MKLAFSRWLIPMTVRLSSNWKGLVASSPNPESDGSGFPYRLRFRLGQLISLLLCLAEAQFLLRLLGDVPSTSAAQRGQGSVSDEPQPDYASPKPQAGCRPALGPCGQLFLVESRSHLVCCGRRRDRDVGFEDSNASRLLHGSSAIRTKTTVVRQLVSVKATVPVHYDSTLRLAAFPLHTPCQQGYELRGE
jgi:hypothetical protein